LLAKPAIDDWLSSADQPLHAGFVCAGIVGAVGALLGAIRVLAMRYFGFSVDAGHLYRAAYADRNEPEVRLLRVAALEQLARDGQAGAVTAEPRGRLEVVVVVGEPGRRAHWAASKSAERSPHGPLAGEAAGGAAGVGLVDGDVYAGVADGLAGGTKRRASPSSARIGDRGQRADPVVAHQRAAAELVPGIGAKVGAQRRQLGLVRVD
jgi:hypothetical protein